MNHFVVFFKKEIRESISTYRLLIMLMVFLIFGIMNPLVAKITPDLVSKFMPEGVSISVPEPSSIDSWAQFFKNIQQMGLIVMMLVFSGVLTGELTKGTLINLLTKGLTREAVITAKYAAMMVIWSISVVISFVVTWAYTVYLFPDGKSQNLFFAVFCLWVFGAFLLAVLLLASTLVTGSYGSLLMVGGVVVGLTILNIIPAVQDYNPLSLASQNMAVVTSAVEFSTLWPALALTLVASVLLVLLAIASFRKKQI